MGHFSRSISEKIKRVTVFWMKDLLFLLIFFCTSIESYSARREDVAHTCSAAAVKGTEKTKKNLHKKNIVELAMTSLLQVLRRPPARWNRIMWMGVMQWNSQFR